MEDAHTTIPNLENTGTSFFAVFDGHGGKILFFVTSADNVLYSTKLTMTVPHLSSSFFGWRILGAAVAKYCGQFLHKKVLDEPTFAEKKYENALRDGFLKTDHDLREGEEFALCTN